MESKKAGARPLISDWVWNGFGFGKDGKREGCLGCGRRESVMSIRKRGDLKKSRRGGSTVEKSSRKI